MQGLLPVIPATWEAEIRRIIVQDQLRQKVRKIPSQSKSGPEWYMSSIQVLGRW
jgi:hypothetical protein